MKVKSKKKYFLNSIGKHISQHNGDGIDFKEIREYNTGNDIRHVNWKVTARNKKPFVNIFNEEKQVNVVLVFLSSGSIFFGTSNQKINIMNEVMENLSTSIINNNDRLSSVFFNEDLIYYIKPSTKKGCINNITSTIDNINPLGTEINYSNLEKFLLKTIKQKSVIILVGDFLEIPDINLLSKKHEVFCIVIRDRYEEKLVFDTTINYIDTNANNLEELEITLDNNSINKFNKEMENYDFDLNKYFKKKQIRNQKIYTDDDVLQKLYVFFS
jgi:uncharacterized protein (DUF58 family)